MIETLTIDTIANAGMGISFIIYLIWQNNIFYKKIVSVLENIERRMERIEEKLRLQNAT